MGINDLLKLYRHLMIKEQITHFQGKTCAVDMMVWLYRGVYASINNPSTGPLNDLYLNFPLKLLSLLKSNNITAICVFDGKNLLAKSSELLHRKEFKEFNINLSQKTSSSEEKRKILNRALNVTPKMINTLINVLENLDQKIIVAPFEADAQIGFLYKTKQIDFAISEDSDLIPYGVKKIAFKLDQFGNMDFLDLSEENFTNNIKRIDNNENILSNEKEISKFLLNLNQDKLIKFCVLLGCDYLSSIKGLGVKGCIKLIKEYEDLEIIVKMMKLSGKFFLSENEDSIYIENVNNAISVFYFQIIYDNINKKLKYLTNLDELDYERGKDNIQELKRKSNLLKTFEKINKNYYGEFFDNYEDYCNGKIDVKTEKKEKEIESKESVEKYSKRFIDLKLENFEFDKDDLNIIKNELNDIKNNIEKEIKEEEKNIELNENKEENKIEEKINKNESENQIKEVNEEYLENLLGKKRNLEISELLD